MAPARMSGAIALSMGAHIVLAAVLVARPAVLHAERAPLDAIDVDLISTTEISPTSGGGIPPASEPPAPPSHVAPRPRARRPGPLRTPADSRQPPVAPPTPPSSLADPSPAPDPQRAPGVQADAGSGSHALAAGAPSGGGVPGNPFGGPPSSGGAGAGGAVQLEMAAYLARVRARLEAARRYPEPARLRGDEARIALRLEIDRAGRARLLDLGPADAPSELLAAARQAVASAGQHGALPAGWSAPRVTARVTLAFELVSRRER